MFCAASSLVWFWLRGGDFFFEKDARRENASSTDIVVPGLNGRLGPSAIGAISDLRLACIFNHFPLRNGHLVQTYEV